MPWRPLVVPCANGLLVVFFCYFRSDLFVADFVLFDLISLFLFYSSSRTFCVVFPVCFCVVAGTFSTAFRITESGARCLRNHRKMLFCVLIGCW